jgi:type II secretory ATPase GspE/PulE/Tfp pilus assembly ATPase PilB-like protein
MEPIEQLFERQFAGLDPKDPQYAVEVVDRLLAAGRELGASDLHLQPAPEGLEVRFRIDGLLSPGPRFPAALSANIIARLKVRAELLTYRNDVPQEGRIRTPQNDVEMRVSTFPTLYGERAVVRLFAGPQRYQRLDDLGLPEDVLVPLRRLLQETSGAILATGPAGCGKTTTIYACMREVAACSGAQRSLVSLEDPIEVAVPAVAQSQVNPAVHFDLATGLRFLMRQDPEVIMVGEIRDRATAEAALQASLTGHLLLSTFHAGSAAETVGRLLDMGIEPYVLRSGLLAILNQRLFRRLCPCAEPTDDPDARLGLAVERAMGPRGCSQCGGTGYRGRLVLAEMLTLSRGELARAVLARSETAVIERLAAEAGMVSRWQRACRAVDEGLTSPAEIRRVLGFSGGPGQQASPSA